MYMVRVGEIFLKGKNRNLFFNQLYANLKEHNIKIIKKFQSKFLVEDTENLKFIFGISNYSKVIECTHEELKDKALNLIKDHKTFCVRVKRTDKVLKPSPELEREIGEYIFEKKPIKVNFKNPDIKIQIDILKDKAFIFTEKIQGLGGLPIGTEGTVQLTVKDKIKSTVAGYLMLKRGCNIVTDKELKELNIFHNIQIGKAKTIVTDETLETLNTETEFTLRPLIGYKKEEINDIYNFILKLNKQ